MGVFKSQVWTQLLHTLSHSSVYVNCEWNRCNFATWGLFPRFSGVGVSARTGFCAVPRTHINCCCRCSFSICRTPGPNYLRLSFNMRCEMRAYVGTHNNTDIYAMVRKFRRYENFFIPPYLRTDFGQLYPYILVHTSTSTASAYASVGLSWTCVSPI